MIVLNEFRTDVHFNQIYRGRLEYERVRAEKERALARDERLAARLRALGVDPDSV